MRLIVTLTFLFLFFSPLPALEAAAAGNAQESLKPAPIFALPDINGKKVSLSDFKGKVVLINFWATWCGPCKAEMPSLNSLYSTFKNEGFVVLAVSIDTSEKPVKSFVSEKGIAFPVLMAAALSAVPDERRTASMGFFQAIYAFGMVAGPAVSGLFADSLGLVSTFYLIGALSLVSALAAGALLPHRVRSHEASG